MTLELKPCPFCGSPAEIERGNDHHGEWFNLGCSRHWGKVTDPDANDTCIAGRIYYTEADVSEVEAIAAWNARATQDAAVAAALKRAEGTAVSHAQKHEPFGHPAMGSDEAHIEAARMIAAAIRSLITQPQSDALAAVRAEARRVKPLQWQEFDGSRLGPRHEAASIAGRYAIFTDGAWFKLTWDGVRIGGAIPTLEAAKAAAQQDYEARVLAALAEGTA